MVLQVPIPEPLRWVEPSEAVTIRLHAEKDYTGAYLVLFEEIMKYGRVSTGADHPVMVENRYVMAPSPIPRFDNPKMNDSKALILLGAGREKKIYAVPPHTRVVSLDFDDHPFETEADVKKVCDLCGASGVFMDEIIHPGDDTVSFRCNDTSYCLKRRNQETR
jgi:alpha-D-ribose 1-methylphosphonate 5-phosphate C-P lyase